MAHAATHRKVEGIVVEVDRAAARVVIAHREIPGVMPAMTMPFLADPPSQLVDLRPGARVVFDFESKGGRARNIKVEDASAGFDFKIPKPANLLSPGDSVPDFTLTDQDNRTVRLSDLRGKLVAVNFVYTRCPLPEICPRLAAHFAYLHKKLGAKVQLLTITLDPLYDTPATLREYAKRWQAGPENWRFLTGGEEAIRTIGGMFGVVFWPEEGAITHTSSTAIVTPEGKLAAVVEGASYRPEQLLALVTTHLR